MHMLCHNGQETLEIDRLTGVVMVSQTMAVTEVLWRSILSLTCCGTVLEELIGAEVEQQGEGAAGDLQPKRSTVQLGFGRVDSLAVRWGENDSLIGVIIHFGFQGV